MIIRWTRPALADLAQICDYIEAENPQAAGMVGRTIRASVEHLSNHPYMGRSGRVAGTRELTVPKLPYLVAYRVRANVVEILAIRHGARRWPRAFPQRTE